MSTKRIISIICVMGVIYLALLFCGCCCLTGSQVFQVTPTPEPTSQVITVTPKPTPIDITQIFDVTPTPTPIVTPQIIYVPVNPTPIPTPYQTNNYPTYTPSSQPTNQDGSRVLWDETKQVQKGYYVYYSAVLTPLTTLNIDISTDGNGVTILVMDAGNFNKYQQGVSSGSSAVWNNYISETSVVQKSFKFTVPNNDRYYIVIDNTGFVLNSPQPEHDVDVHLKVTY